MVDTWTLIRDRAITINGQTHIGLVWTMIPQITIISTTLCLHRIISSEILQLLVAFLST